MDGKMAWWAKAPATKPSDFHLHEPCCRKRELIAAGCPLCPKHTPRKISKV